MPHVLSRSWGWRRRLALIALLATLAVALGLGTGGRFGVGPLVQVAHASAACTGTPRIKATSPRDNLPGGIGYLYAYVQEYVHADGSFCGSNAKGLVHLNEGAASGQMNVRLYDCSGHFLDDMDADVTVHAPTPYTEV